MAKKRARLMSCPFEVSPNTHHGSQTEDAPKWGAFPSDQSVVWKIGDFRMEWFCV